MSTLVTPRQSSARGIGKSPRTKAADSNLGQPPAAVHNGPTLLCVNCRKHMLIDARSWIRVIPPPDCYATSSSPAHGNALFSSPAALSNSTTLGRDFNSAANSLQSYPVSLGQSMVAQEDGGIVPRVVFGVSDTEPPQAPIERGEWIKLSESECLDQMYAVGDFAAEDFPLCTPCWTSRVAERQKTLTRLSSHLRHTIDTCEGLTVSDVTMALQPASLVGDTDAIQHVAATGSETDTDTQELNALREQLQALEREDATLNDQLHALQREEDSVAGQVNDLLAAQWLAIDDQERILADRRRLEASVSTLR